LALSLSVITSRRIWEAIEDWLPPACFKVSGTHGACQIGYREVGKSGLYSGIVTWTFGGPRGIEVKGVPYLRVFGKGGKTRYLPLHPGTNALIH
jgi:hypothetical protein